MSTEYPSFHSGDGSIILSQALANAATATVAVEPGCKYMVQMSGPNQRDFRIKCPNTSTDEQHWNFAANGPFKFTAVANHNAATLTLSVENQSTNDGFITVRKIVD